jgi:hypothetical protein
MLAGSVAYKRRIYKLRELLEKIKKLGHIDCKTIQIDVAIRLFNQNPRYNPDLYLMYRKNIFKYFNIESKKQGDLDILLIKKSPRYNYDYNKNQFKKNIDGYFRC